MVETLFGLARLGHTDDKGMPNLLQLALIAQEFSDVVVFRSPSAGSAARAVWRPRTGRTLARLSRDLSATLAHVLTTRT